MNPFPHVSTTVVVLQQWSSNDLKNCGEEDHPMLGCAGKEVRINGQDEQVLTYL